MSTSKLRGADFENMSVDQMMDLNINDVQKLVNIILPKGLYTGNVQEWALPTPEDTNYHVQISNLSPIELDDPSEENLAILDSMPDDYVLRQRYNTGVGFQALCTEWEPLILAKYDGSIGAMIVQSMEGNDDITFRIDHRKVTNQNTKEVMTYVKVAEVSPA